MNRIILIASIIILGGCQKPESSPNGCYPYIQDCVHSYSPVAFKGFTTEEIKEITLYKYVYGNNFGNKIEQHSIKFENDFVNNETIFYHLVIKDSFDYEIEIPAADTSYFIHSEKIPSRTDTIECYTKADQYGPKCRTHAPIIWVNGDTGIRKSTTGPNPPVYLLLEK